MIMRSKVAFTLLGLVVMVSAWAQNDPIDPCPGPDSNPGFVQINIFYNSTTTSAPSIKIAHPGDVLKFKLLGRPGVKVQVDGKESDDKWIKKSGSNRHFFVCVPRKIVHPQDYEYSVDPDEMPGTPPFNPPLLDPVVRIL